MIDLDQAAAELTASVAHVQPDLPRVQSIARRHQRRRRRVLTVGAVALLVGGAAAALVATDGPARESEDVRTTPSPDAVHRLVDVGLLRFTVPDGWKVEDGSVGGCGGPGVIVIGAIAPNVPCREATSLRILPMEGDPNPESDESRNGIPIQGPISTGLVGSGSTVHLPTLRTTLLFAEGVSTEPILSTIAMSARQVALADLDGEAAIATAGLDPEAVTGWRRDPDRWQKIELDGVSVQVPASWPVSHRDGPGGRSGDPCAAWGREGPVAAIGTGPSNICEPGAIGRPVDGVWLLPLEGTTAEGISAADDRTIGDAHVRILLWGGNVLEVYVVRDRNPILVRIGLGVDGHLAGSILTSIRAGGEPTARPITLPCGPTVVADRATLDLPDDLDVSVLQGMGGTGGIQEKPCAVNLTATDNPGRHISFVRSGLGGDADQVITGVRDVRWGKIYEGYGAELKAHDSDEPISVVAHGVTEAEMEALLVSLSAT